jgi:hypothetical protein
MTLESKRETPRSSVRTLPDDLPHEVVVEHVLPLDCGELLFDELAHVGQILRGVNCSSQEMNIFSSQKEKHCQLHIYSHSYVKGNGAGDFLVRIFFHSVLLSSFG